MRGVRGAGVALSLLLSSSTFSSSVLAARHVVLAVPGDPPSQQAAADVKAALKAKGEAVDDDAAVRLRLYGPAGAPVDVAVARAAVVAADDAFAALDHERSVSILEGAIVGLEQDKDFSAEKRALLEEARLSCAGRLLGLAGPGESGKGETRNGESARRHLQNAIKANPALELGGRFPPKMRTLFALAQDDVKAAGSAGLNVKSTPPGATVLLDGRAVGATPLVAPAVAAPGTWRLWLEKDGRRSVARVVTLEKGSSVNVEIDLSFEGALVPAPDGKDAPPAVSPTTPLSPAQLSRLAGLVSADVVVLTGKDAGKDDSADDDAVWAVTATPTSTPTANTVQQARGRDGAAVVAALGSKDAGTAPATVLATTTSTTPAPTKPAVGDGDDEEGEGFPWLVAGGAAAGAVVVAAGVVAGVALFARTTTVTYVVEEIP